MKQLQNNFTTLEQSKRLLELGVPADSADIGRVNDIMHGSVEILTIPYTQWCKGYENISTPCWSVGRLIEIYHICDKPGCSFSFHVCFHNLINEMVYKIVEAKEHGWINFSKLEE